MTAVHVSPYGGSWYPGRPAELELLLHDLFEQSRQRIGPFVLPGALAVLVPHAGLAYSGTVAAAAYRALRDVRPQRIILLGFSHHGGPSGVAIPEVRRLATPLGTVEIEDILPHRVPFLRVPEEVVCDHSVEIQLPFIQHAAPGVPVTLLYVSQIGAAERDAAAEALAALVQPGTVFVASSDLTHYGANFGYLPFANDEHISSRLKELDLGTLASSGSLDCGLFLDELRRSGSTACGYNPVALLLRTLELASGEEIFQERLDYQTSGDITGDFDHCVSYGACAYYRTSAFLLGAEEQGALLASARRTLERLAATGERRAVGPDQVAPALLRHAGVFVSLHDATGNLRGCIGDRSACGPLAHAVPDMTLAAALDDPRFTPLLGSADGLHIEISVLTPMKRVRDASRFRVGEHGAYIECGYQRGLLLPQVARDRDWTPESFLNTLCRKAWVPAKAWLDPDAHLFVFRAQVFG